MEDLLERLKSALAGRYSIERELGSGGMATVYLARDLKHERNVAVKVLRPELAAVLGAERFLREIRVTANLQHPHILPLYDSGSADTFLYYVMPYVEGETLRHCLKRKKQLSIEEAIRIAEQVAAALAYAHRQGIIHRDIKPENILLHEGAATVADFGIALAVRAAGGPRLTETGLSLGTPEYMSPEQATADRELDCGSDIYSLACVLYEMLAGQPPHTGPNTQAIIARLIMERPMPLRTIRDTVPRGVDRAVMQALAKVPADRFATADEFATSLRVGMAERASEVAELVAARPGVAIPATFPPLSTSERLWLGLSGAAALAAYFALYPIHSPPAIDTPQITRGEALTIGREFLAEQGAAGSFTEAVVFLREASERRLLLSTLGFTEAGRWARDEVSVGSWRVRWFTPGEHEEWQVSVGGTGRIGYYWHNITDDVPGANLEQPAAREIADSFLVARGWSLDTLDLVEATSERHASRTDYEFILEQRGSRLVWNAANPDADPGSIRVRMDVRGEDVAVYQHHVDVPDLFDMARAARQIVTDVVNGLSIVLVLLSVGVAVVRQRKGLVEWRPAFAVALVVFGCLLVWAFNGWHDVRYGHDHSAPLLAHLASALTIGVISAIVFCGSALVLAALGESVAREVLPTTLTGFRQALRGRLSRATAAGVLLRGYASGGVLLGVVGAVATGTALLWPDAVFRGSVGYLDYLDVYVPGATATARAVGLGLGVGVSLMVVLAFLKRYVRSTALAVLIPAVVLIAVEVPFTLSGEEDVVRVLAWYLVGTFAFLRYGILVSIVCMWSAAMADHMVPMFTAGEARFTVSAVLMLVLLMIPVAAALAVVKRQGQPPGGYAAA